MLSHRPASCPRPALFAVAGTLLLLPAVATAHGPVDHPPTLSGAWSLSPWSLLPMVLMLLLYAAGLTRLWRRAGVGHGVDPGQAGAFAAGALALLLATVWPLDALGEWSLAAHMGQHMLLLAFVPPLLLAGRPLAVAAHALPAAWSATLHRGASRIQGWLVARLAAATAAQVAVMGLWHLPVATGAALAHDGIHWLMHGSFLAAGFWFWAAMWQRLRDPQTGAAPALVAIVAVMMQMGFLGALLTFSARPLYPVYAVRAPQLGLDVITDQQLAGLVMWVPACVPYLVGGLWLVLRWLQRAERRQPPGGPLVP